MDYIYFDELLRTKSLSSLITNALSNQINVYAFVGDVLRFKDENDFENYQKSLNESKDLFLLQMEHSRKGWSPFSVNDYCLIHPNTLEMICKKNLVQIGFSNTEFYGHIQFFDNFPYYYPANLINVSALAIESDDRDYILDESISTHSLSSKKTGQHWEEKRNEILQAAYVCLGEVLVDLRNNLTPKDNIFRKEGAKYELNHSAIADCLDKKRERFGWPQEVEGLVDGKRHRNIQSTLLSASKYPKKQ